MTREEEDFEIARNAFLAAFERERNSEDRLDLALKVFETVRRAKYPGVVAHVEANRLPTVIDQLKGERLEQRALPTLQRVARLHSCEISELRGPSRYFVVARDEACWSLSAEGMEQQDIGTLFGGRTQAAISRAVDRHRRRELAAAAAGVGPNERKVARGR